MRALLTLLAAASALAQTPRSDCFPLDRLSAEERSQADALFLKILDGEGLFTVIGGVKPMSSGFSRFVLDAGAPDTIRLDMERRWLESFRCGEEIYATIQHFQRTNPNPKTGRTERSYEGVVFHRASLRILVARMAAFFFSLGLTPHAHPMEILMSVEHASNAVRWRGLGYLYGYPDHAVEFFVDAGVSQEEGGPFVERDFISHPTFERAERGVVYAVPKAHLANETDRGFEAQLKRVLADYTARRARFIGPGKPGAAALLRDWFCGASATCIAPR